MLRGNERILDPFGGTGKIFSLLNYHPNLKISAVEIEPEWASLDSRITLGNALDLKYPDNSFDYIITSPCYGNRMADTLIDKYKRITYTAALGRKLNKDNSGSLQWGEKYREFHVKAWNECKRVLRNNGTFVLNIKNHIRKGIEQKVTEWHIETLESIGFKLFDLIPVETPSMKFGQNRNARIPYESIVIFILYK
jgi:tRNA G10  N-methylase Trm11